MNKRILLALIISISIFCIGCNGGGGILGITNDGWTDAEVFSYFDKQSDLFGMMAQFDKAVKVCREKGVMDKVLAPYLESERAKEIFGDEMKELKLLN